MKGSPPWAGGLSKSKPTWWNTCTWLPPRRLFAFDPGGTGGWPTEEIAHRNPGGRLLFSNHNGIEIMIHRKVEGKPQARSGRSLAARLLTDAVRATLPVPPPEEPWRAKKPKGKSRGKKRK